MENATRTVMESNNILSIVEGLNEATNGWLIGLLLIMMFFVTISTIMTFTMMSFNKSMMITSFIMTIIAMLFWVINMIDLVFAFIFVVLLIFSIGRELF